MVKKVNTYRSIGIVKFIPDDARHSQKSFLSSEPRCHASIDDHTKFALIFSVQAKFFLHGIVNFAMTFLLPSCGVEDDLNTSVYHTGSFVRMRTTFVEFSQELSLFLHTCVFDPASTVWVPSLKVY